MKNVLARQRKIKKIRKTIHRLQVVRLSVHRTPKHIYAQVIATDGKVLASASSLEKIVAKLVGKLIAERAQDKVEKVAFDRSGFKYHGRIKALADSARECGLNF